MIALLLLVAPAQPYVHPPQGSAGVQATVSLEVRERRDLRSPPRAWVELRITGPTTLEVEPAKFSNEVRAWRVLRGSSWTPTADGLVVTQSFVLEQTRSGEQPLPGLSVRVRAGSNGATQVLEWPDLFGGPLQPPGVDEPPEQPAPDWTLAYTVVGVLGAGTIALIWRLTRRPPTVHVATPQEIAVTALTEFTQPGAWTDPRSAATRLGAIVREYLAARTGLDLHPRTVRECLVLLRACPLIAPENLPELEALLAWCDATRFAGPHADASSGPVQAARAVELVPRLCVAAASHAAKRRAYVRTTVQGTLACASRIAHNLGETVLALQGTTRMASPEQAADDIFLPGGRLRAELLTETANTALREAVRLAGETQWDSVRSPHVFMGLLAAPDPRVGEWGRRLQADLNKLLDQFQELFHQDEGDAEAVLILNREFLSDNVIRLLRDALARARDYGRTQITPMDLLISLLTATNSIVAECFARIGVTAAKLTEIAVLAEHTRLDRSGR